MCNCLHLNDSIPIPENGFGYKVFIKEFDHCPTYGAIYSTTAYCLSIGDTLIWNSIHKGDGFCFFRSFELAKIYQEKISININMSEYIVSLCKIEYKKGLGEHEEFQCFNLRICLCKEFKILEEL